MILVKITDEMMSSLFENFLDIDVDDAGIHTYTFDDGYDEVSVAKITITKEVSE